MSKLIDYIPTKNVVLRFPAYTINTINKAFADEDYFKTIISNKTFREAIYFSSPSLYKEMEKYLSGKLSNRDSQRMEITLFKYLARMSTRCTPFASLASCLVTSLGDDPQIIIGEQLCYRFRLDMSLSCAISDLISNSNNVMKKLRYKVNTTVYKSGNLIRYISFDRSITMRNYAILQMKSTSLLRFLLTKTDGYLYYQDIVNLIGQNFLMNRMDIERYVDTLISIGFLISEAEVGFIGEDPLKHTAGICCNNYKIKVYFQDIENKLSKLNKAISYEERMLRVNAIRDFISNSGVKNVSGNLLRLDTFGETKCKLNVKIIRQLNDCIDMFSRVAAISHNQVLENFRENFKFRYEGREVPLLEVLDPDIGIGYSMYENYKSLPLIDELKLPQRKAAVRFVLSPLQKLVLDKMLSLNKSKIIEIQDDDIKVYKVVNEDLPNSIAAMFKIIDYNKLSGRYVLSDVHFICGAANLLGRFSYDEKVKDIVDEIVDKDQYYYKDSIVAEINHVPDLKSGNILSRPSLREYEIECLANSYLDKCHIISLSDILVSVRGRKIVLRSKTLGKEVIPRLTTAHNYRIGTVPLYRFLCDLQGQYQGKNLFFSWGVLNEMFTHFPRIMYKDMILSPETWKIERKSFSGSKRRKISIEEFKDYVSKNQISRYVELNRGDNKLYIDLYVDKSIKILISEVLNLEAFSISEFLPSKNVVVKGTSKEPVMNECIVTLFRNGIKKN